MKTLFERVITECTGQAGARGCLAAKAAMELAPRDKDVAAWFRRFHERNLGILVELIQRGQQRGEFSKSLSADAAARFVLNHLAGLRLMGATSPSEAEVRPVVDMVLKALE